MTGWCGWGLACRLRATFEVGEFRRALWSARRLASGRRAVSVLALRYVGGQGRCECIMPELQDALLPPRFHSPTNSKCLRLVVDGRNCASKRVHLSNKSVPPQCHGGLNSCWSHANEGRQTETLFHTYSQFGSTPNIPAKPSEEELRVETRLNEILEQVLSHARLACAALTWTTERRPSRSAFTALRLRVNTWFFGCEAE